MSFRYFCSKYYLVLYKVGLYCISHSVSLLKALLTFPYPDCRVTLPAGQFAWTPSLPSILAEVARDTTQSATVIQPYSQTAIQPYSLLQQFSHRAIQPCSIQPCSNKGCYSLTQVEEFIQPGRFRMFRASAVGCPKIHNFYSTSIIFEGILY